MDFTPGERIHFIGLGGAGMSALAWVLLSRGCRVSGSDLRDGPVMERLRRRGAEARVGHHGSAVAGSDLVIYSAAVPAENTELRAARELGIPALGRGEALARLVRGGQVVAVAGSHGKTTTAAMVAKVLSGAGYDPTIMVGGEMEWLGGNARAGSSSWYVVEADESDGSFLALNPRVGVITNVEDDHLDHYGSIQGICQAFARFGRGIEPGGVLVHNADCPLARQVEVSPGVDQVTFGQGEEAAVKGSQARFSPAGTRVRVAWAQSPPWWLYLPLVGMHNVYNALATVGVAQALGISAEQLQQGLSNFTTVKRRFEHLAKVGGVDVVDDYGHHPTEVKLTVETARNLASSRLVVVFQPHRYSRTRQLADRFGASFAGADLVVVTDVYAAGEKPIPGVTGETIAREVRKYLGPDQVQYLPELESVPGCLAQGVGTGDLVLTLGAGNVRWVGEDLIERLRTRSADRHHSQDNWEYDARQEKSG